jgi:hypothetical protein
MTPPQKPEWMELADADSVPVIKKKTRFIPALIASAALAIVGVGAIASQITDEAPASATEQIAPVQSNSSPAAVHVTPQATTVAIAPTNTNPVPPMQSAQPKQPKIASLPSGGGDDEGRGEHDEREGNDD